MIGVLLLIVPIVGVVLAVLYMPHDQLLSIAKWAGGIVAVFYFLSLWTHTEESASEFLYSDDGDYPVEGAMVEQIDGHTVLVTPPKGNAYLVWKDREGVAFFQEVDKRGQSLGQAWRGADNAGRFGMTVNQQITRHIRRKINTER